MAFLRSSLALGRLRIHLNALGLSAVALYGLAFPGALFAWAGSRGALEGDPVRALAGLVAISALLLIVPSTAFAIASETEGGRRSALKSALVDRWIYLGSHAVNVAVLAAVPVAVAGVASALYVDAGMPHPQAALPYLLCAVSLWAVAVLVAGITDNTAVTGLLSHGAVTLCVALCPLLYPAERVPAWLAPVVGLLPPTLAVDGLVAAWDGGWTLEAMAKQAAVAALLVVAAVRGFRW